MVLEKTLESPMDCKEIREGWGAKPGHTGPVRCFFPALGERSQSENTDPA